MRYVCADCSICFQTEADIQEHIGAVHNAQAVVVDVEVDSPQVDDQVQVDTANTERSAETRLTRSSVGESTLGTAVEVVESSSEGGTDGIDRAGHSESFSAIEETPPTAKTDLGLGETGEGAPVAAVPQSSLRTPSAISAATGTASSLLLRVGAACHICLKWLSSAATLRSHLRICQMVNRKYSARTIRRIVVSQRSLGYQ